ncbi:DUF1365 domain-containing protein [Rhodocyclus gracilis]|uniref:DUF1365 family protein n=1 Tax=Rhodocyclus tenuis TaxID=1066 RepID=A0A6L5K041_RHOTE|nr:DUF1365 family protein [Rhodocyclus gracilis]
MSESVARIGFGQVMHSRLRPALHRFVYPVYFFLLPLTRIEQAGSRFFSINRFNLFSFRYADHGDRDGSSPLLWIRKQLAAANLPTDGEVWLQTFPRVLGINFNPVSFWFCHDADGALIAILAEVSNTFGERHHYLLAHPDGSALGNGELLERRKVFHVSPFNEVQGGYCFRFQRREATGVPFATPPVEPQIGEQRLARIDYADADGDLLLTSVSGRVEALSGAALRRAALVYPWQSLLVLARIHWQALLLWRKRVPFFRKPDPPLEETTR